MNHFFASSHTHTKFSIYFTGLLILTFVYAGNGGVYWWGWPALSLLIAGVLFFTVKQINITGLFMAVSMYLLLMLNNILWINPVLHIEGLYFLTFFALSFLLGRSFNRTQLHAAFLIALVCFCLLAIWGLFQYFTGMGFINFQANRANTVYTTPNSFAAAVNLVLLPLLMFRLCKVEKRSLDNIILLLLAALFVSQSRGGWIAFVGGLSIGLLLLAVSKQLKLVKTNALLTLKAIIMIICFAIYHQSDTQQSLVTRNALNTDNSVEQTVQFSSIAHRLHFYQIAWDQFLEKPLFGNGYFNYKYFLDRDNTKELAQQGTTHFVHNDYLQHLLETGVAGFSALMFLILVFFYQAWKNYRQVQNEEKIFIIAIVSSCCAFFIHAFGDFVFYPAAITLFFGITLGYFDQLTQLHSTFHKINFSDSRHVKLFKLLVFIALISIFTSPVIARTFALDAEKSREAKAYTDSFHAIKRAQFFAPYEAHYQYLEARLWLDAVNAQNNSEAANTADKLLQKAIALNPFEKYLLLERSKLHRDYPHLLDEPVSINKILKWQEEVLHWQSKIKNNAAQTEYIKTLKQAGRNEEARDLYLKFQQELMQSRGMKNLLHNIFNPEG